MKRENKHEITFYHYHIPLSATMRVFWSCLAVNLGVYAALASLDQKRTSTASSNPYAEWNNSTSRKGLEVDLGYEVYCGETDQDYKINCWKG